MDLFELVGTIAIKNEDANRALDETSNKGQQTQSKLGKAFSAVGKGAAVVGKTIGTGLLAGGAAMGTLTAKALNLSGELEQNMGGSKQVFGEYADEMQAKAEEAFSNMGLSTSDFLGTANKMGALFQGAGFSIQESSELSASAMQRAADVASIMGIDTSAAMEAIAGAAKGNFTMMDNLGVAMNDTAIQNYALEKGINKTTAEMTQQEKIGLAMEMFMEKTAYAAGNYAKENETLAGSLGTAKSALTNFLDGSGDVDQLVGAFENAATVIVDNVETIAPRLIGGITSLISKITPKLPGLLSKLLPTVIEGAVSLISGLAAALPELMDVLVTSVIPQLLSGIVTVAEALIGALPGLIESICTALPVLLPQLISGIVSVIVMLCENFSSIIQPIIDNLPAIIISVVDALLENLPILLGGILQLIIGIAQAIPSLLGALWTTLKGVFSSLVSKFGEWFKPVAEWFTEVWNNFVEIVKGVWEKIKTAVSDAISSVRDTISNIWNSIKTTTSNIWNGIKGSITSVWTNIKSGVSKAINGVRDTVSNVFNGIKTTATNIWNSIKSAIQKPIEKARDLVKTAIEKIKGFFDFEFKWPKIKMPHFGITPAGWKIGDLLDGSIPKLSIQWYAEAMKNPMIMTKPTLFGYNPATGSLMGGGEAGSEVVSGTATLLNMIQQAVRGENSGLAQRLERIINLLVQFFPDALQAMQTPMLFDTNGAVLAMAPAMDVALGKIAIQKGRGR